MKKMFLLAFTVCLLAAAGQAVHKHKPLPVANSLTGDPYPVCPPTCNRN